MAPPAKVIAHPALNRKGRAKGSKNRYATVKTDMFWVYKQLGGKKEMLKWAKHGLTNQEVFYRELLRLIPKELDLETPIGNLRLVMDIDGDEKGMDAEAAAGDD